jgi:hypothetical protein
MRVAALFSGGKDSTYAAHIAEERGHEVAFLVSIEPARPDSWMFHSVNIHLAPLLAEAMGKRHVSAATRGEKERELVEADGGNPLSLYREGTSAGGSSSTIDYPSVLDQQVTLINEISL